MIHIVFNQADVTVMEAVIALDESLSGDIIAIKDDYAVGPLSQLDEAEGWQARRDWWKELLADSPYQEQLDMVDDKLTVHRIKERLEAEAQEVVWIWAAQNQHDVCGYYWLMRQLSAYQGRIHILYLNNLPFLNDKGLIFYPQWLHEIQPKEFLKAKKLARPITLSEFEVDPDEWKRLMEENGMVRQLEGGKKIVSKDISFYDDALLAQLSNDWQKATRVINKTIDKLSHKTGDVFLMGRIKAMANQGTLHLQGDAGKGWKEIDVKKADGSLPFGGEALID